MKFEQKLTFINFLFPLYPLKTFKNTWTICVLAILVALRLLMGKLSINIEHFGMSFSIAHTPLILIGWMYGPIIGFFIGALTDTLGFFFSGGKSLWFWMYAIQEPLLGFISGLISSIYIWRKNKKNIVFDIIFTRIFCYSFTIIVLFLMFTYATEDTHFKLFESKDLWKKYKDDYLGLYKYLAIGFVLLFTLVFEIFNITVFAKKKNAKIFIYISVVCYINAMLFSFLLGTISAIEYYKFSHNLANPPMFIKYGYMFYLLPRIIKESIKTPLQIIVLYSLLCLIIPIFKQKKKYLALTWDYQRNLTKNIIHKVFYI